MIIIQVNPYLFFSRAAWFGKRAKAGKGVGGRALLHEKEYLFSVIDPSLLEIDLSCTFLLYAGTYSPLVLVGLCMSPCHLLCILPTITTITLSTMSMVVSLTGVTRSLCWESPLFIMVLFFVRSDSIIHITGALFLNVDSMDCCNGECIIGVHAELSHYKSTAVENRFFVSVESTLRVIPDLLIQKVGVIV
jgi:hypothetical protein